MRQVKSYQYIGLGLFLRYLRHVDKELREHVIHAINELISGLESCGFEVSLAGCQNLKYILLTMTNKKDVNLTSAEVASLEIAITDLENIISAEALTKDIWVIESRRFNLDYLLREQDKLFKKSVLSDVAEITKHDIISGCRCIALGEATAAAFHLLRAVESNLRSYYCKLIKRNRISSLMWGPIITALRQKKSNKPSTVLLDSLDMIRKSYRNPTQHPEAIYDIEQAQDLLGVCIDVINKMHE